MNIAGVCGAAIVCAILSLLVKKHNGEAAFALQVCGCVIIILYVIGEVSQITETILDMAEDFSINMEYIEVIIKALGICFLTEFASDCCNDAGCSALGNNVLLCGKIMILISAMPMLQDLLSLALGLLSAG